MTGPAVTPLVRADPKGGQFTTLVEQTSGPPALHAHLQGTRSGARSLRGQQPQILCVRVLANFADVDHVECVSAGSEARGNE